MIRLKEELTRHGLPTHSLKPALIKREISPERREC